MVHVMKNPSLGKRFLGVVAPVSTETSPLSLGGGGGPRLDSALTLGGCLVTFMVAQYDIDMRFAILTV